MFQLLLELAQLIPSNQESELYKEKMRHKTGATTFEEIFEPEIC